MTAKDAEQRLLKLAHADHLIGQLGVEMIAQFSAGEEIYMALSAEDYDTVEDNCKCRTCRVGRAYKKFSDIW